MVTAVSAAAPEPQEPSYEAFAAEYRQSYLQALGGTATALRARLAFPRPALPRLGKQA